MSSSYCKMRIIRYFVLLLLTIQVNAHKRNKVHKQKVCVIGAGISGLASVKRLADHSDEFEPIAFERNSDVGGQWIYTDSTTVDEHGLPVHSSIYKNLRTNVPKELIAWPDYRNFTGDDRSSVPHYLVLQYLRNYTDHFNLRQYIKLNTLVELVYPIDPDNKDWRKTLWVVRTKNLNTDVHTETICNAVMVCNGHFTKPNIPKIPGLEKFQGPVIHSHTYRKPELFTNKTVAVLGGSVSGVDIAVDVSSQSKKIYLSHRHDKIQSELPKNIEQVPGIIKANGNDLILSNGSSIHADGFIFCTGYLPEFPFLDQNCGIEIKGKGHVFPLYKQMINAKHPSLSVIGITTATSIYLIPYMQSQYFVALLQGKVELPSYEEMIKDANTEPPGAPKGKFHAVNDYQWTYNEELAKAGGFELPPSFYKDGLHLYESYRDSHLATFRDVLFRFNQDGTFRLVEPQQNTTSTWGNFLNWCYQYFWVLG